MTLSLPAHSRRVAFAAFVALLALAAMISATPAMASTENTPCGHQVVADWFAHRNTDGKVHGHYPLHCYSDALGSLDPAVDTYTNARDAINAALAAERLICKTNCGPGGPNGPDGSNGLPTKLPRGEKWIAFRNTSGAHDPVKQPPPPITAIPTSNPSSVPVPLLVLAGLAGALLLAGGGSYVARRVKASRSTPPATPPATDS
jgi:hypothetical protein